MATAPAGRFRRARAWLAPMATLWRHRHLRAVILPLLLWPLDAARADIPALPAELGPGLRALALLEVEGKRACSAALISPSEVLTAAHCVADRALGLRVPPAGLILRFGAAGENLRRGVAEIVVRPGYIGSAEPSGPADLATDLALLRLAEPVSAEEITPFSVAEWDGALGGFVDVPGFLQDGAEGPVWQEGCMVLDLKAGVGVLSCEVLGGMSGAPVLVQGRPGEAPRLVASVSSRSPGRAFVVEIAPNLAVLRGALP